MTFTSNPSSGARPPLGPTPQDFADALFELQKTAPGRIRTPAALGTDLLAAALLQYGEARARLQANASPSPGPPAPPGPASAGTTKGAPDGAPFVSPPLFNPSQKATQFGTAPPPLSIPQAGQ
jgi:hypothetical protein